VKEEEVAVARKAGMLKLKLRLRLMKVLLLH